MSLLSLPIRLSVLCRPLRLIALVVLSVMSAATAAAQRVNLAKYQAVTANSVNTSYVADFATDGIVSNFHALRTNNITSNFFTLELTYPRPVTVASAHLFSGLLESATPTQVLSGYRYQYHDGDTWITITSVLNNTSPEVATLFPQAVTASRFRLLGISNGFFAIRELAFFPPNLVGGIEQGYPLGTDLNLNLAHKRPATASSAQLVNANGPGYAKNAFDGYLDNRSRWLIQPVNNVYSAGETLEVDLLSTHSVGSAHVFSGIMNAARVNSSPIPDFTLEYWSGTAWLPIPGAAVVGNTQAARLVEFTSPVSTNRIRLVTTSATPARLQELLLFPPRAGGYALGREVIDAAPPADTWERYSDSFYRVRNTGPDMRIGLVNGAIVNVPADPAFPQRTEWQLLLNYRDGTYRLRNADSGLCLALSQISIAEGLPVVAEDYTGLPHQDWRLVYSATTPAQFALVNAYSGLALQPLNNSWASGTPLVVSAYVANLNLQHWTASLRRAHPKKGVAATAATIGTRYTAAPGLTYHEDFHNRLNAHWSYTWNKQLSASFPYLRSDFTYNPMQWGNFGWTHGNANSAPLERSHRDLQSSGKPMHVLGFNEPEHEEQGYTTVDDAIRLWPRLEARDAPLVSPAPASTYSLPWFQDFVTRADALGYRRDFTAVHWYSAPNASSLIMYLTNIYNDFGRPIWLTEFGNTRWSGTNTWAESDSYDFLIEFMWRAESLSWLKRYSIFGYIEEAPGAPAPVSPDPEEAPRSNIIRYDGSLTPLGQLYAGWDGVTSVIGNRAYHLHNHGEYRRAFNPGASDSPGVVSPDAPDLGVQWFLGAGVTANTWRILSTRDGRPLRTIDGTSVSFGTAGQSGPEVEWRLVAEANGYGRHFIEHPATGRRLRADTNGTLGLGALTSTGAAFKWRFIGPAVSDPVSPPATPTGVSAVATANRIALSWSPVADAISYTVERAPAPTGPWTIVATDIEANTLSDPDLAWSTTYHYRVKATNRYALVSPTSLVVSASTSASPDPYLSWVAAYSWPAPTGTNSASTADPDGDGLPNLLEYALATAPLSSTPLPLALHVAGAGAQPVLSITFSRVADPALSYAVEASGDLAVWSVIWTSTGAQNVPGPVTVTDSAALTDASRRFLRVRVSR